MGQSTAIVTGFLSLSSCIPLSSIKSLFNPTSPMTSCHRPLDILERIHITRDGSHGFRPGASIHPSTLFCLPTRMVEIHASHPLVTSVPRSIDWPRVEDGVVWEEMHPTSQPTCELTKRNQSMRCSCKGRFLGVTSSWEKHTYTANPLLWLIWEKEKKKKEMGWRWLFGLRWMSIRGGLLFF